MKLIAGTHYKRPDYSRRLIEALRACKGIEDYTLLWHVEPGDDEVRSILEAIDFAEKRLVFNAERIGYNGNTEATLAHAFALTDYVVYMEDDLIPAPDTLEYFEWAADFKADPKLFSISGYNRLDRAPDGPLWHVARDRMWFVPWGWATWDDRWDRVRGRLNSVPEWTADTWLIERVILPDRLHELYPVVGRVQNLGLVSSLHDWVTPEFVREKHTTPFWAGDVDVPSGNWRRDREFE